MLYCGLPQMLRQFQQRHAGLQVLLHELSSQDQLLALQQDQLDLGLVHTTRVPAPLSRLLVASQPFVACLPRAHRLAKKHRLDLAELRGEPFGVVGRAVSPDYHERIVALCVAAGFHPDLRYELRHWLSVVSLVSQGLGVALVPQALKATALADTVFIPLSDPGAPYDTYCLWKTASTHPALAAFVDTVRAGGQGG